VVNPISELPSNLREKFLIQTARISKEHEDDNKLTAWWSEVGRLHIPSEGKYSFHDQRIKCKLTIEDHLKPISTGGTPVLEPPNGGLNPSRLNLPQITSVNLENKIGNVKPESPTKSRHLDQVKKNSTNGKDDHPKPVLEETVSKELYDSLLLKAKSHDTLLLSLQKLESECQRLSKTLAISEDNLGKEQNESKVLLETVQTLKGELKTLGTTKDSLRVRDHIGKPDPLDFKTSRFHHNFDDDSLQKWNLHWTQIFLLALIFFLVGRLSI